MIKKICLLSVFLASFSLLDATEIPNPNEQQENTQKLISALYKNVQDLQKQNAEILQRLNDQERGRPKVDSELQTPEGGKSRIDEKQYQELEENLLSAKVNILKGSNIEKGTSDKFRKILLGESANSETEITALIFPNDFNVVSEAHEKIKQICLPAQPEYKTTVIPVDHKNKRVAFRGQRTDENVKQAIVIFLEEDTPPVRITLSSDWKHGKYEYKS